MGRSKVFISVLLVCLLGGGSAFACYITGIVVCDDNQDGVIDASDSRFEGVVVIATNLAGTYTDSFTTDADGFYFIQTLPEGDDYILTLDPTTLPSDAVILLPAAGEYFFPGGALRADWLIDSETCRDTPQDLCWLTAGGVKFESITDTWNAVHAAAKGPKDSVGGVAYPSCSPYPGNGGNWNHVAHSLSLHLLGTDITVIRCGNVEGIDPGSESPVCSVNFIEFMGSGRVQGIHGNHMEPIEVSFFVRAEDRNEPGNEQSADSGEDIDRYFLRVADGEGNVIILVDMDGDPDTVDPLTITGGNFQIHCSSCDGSPAKSAMDLAPWERNGFYFRRGDANFNGSVDLADTVFTLGYLFGEQTAPPCADAADANDDGHIDVGDALYLLTTLYASGPPIPEPFQAVGHDKTTDSLGCQMLLEEIDF
jgi:hypothetical protein